MPLVSKTFSEIITFTRASTATYFNSAGTLTSAAIDEPRLDYNPSTLAAQGLLIEEARTNSIRNNTMVGAVAGTPGTSPTNWTVTFSGSGITQQIVGTGTEDGITYIDVKFSGTGSGTAIPQISTETSTQIVAATGQTWAASYYLRIVGGSTTGCTGTFQQIWQERDAAGASLTTVGVSIADPTTAALRTQRSILTRTLTDAGTARLTNRIQWTFTNGVAVDITLRIGLPQLEQGAFATSVIPTSTIALTRAADVASVNTLSPWYNASEGTLYAEVVYFGLAAATSLGANQIRLFDGTGANLITLRAVVGTGTPAADEVIADSGVASMDTIGITITANTTYKRAIAYSTNNARAAINGAYTDPTDTTVTVPVVNALSFGFASGIYGMWIRRITYYPRRLSDAELQSLTT
jgi:hypothetical protein